MRTIDLWPTNKCHLYRSACQVDVLLGRFFFRAVREPKVGKIYDLQLGRLHISIGPHTVRERGVHKTAYGEVQFVSETGRYLVIGW